MWQEIYSSNCSWMVLKTNLIARKLLPEVLDFKLNVNTNPKVGIRQRFLLHVA